MKKRILPFIGIISAATAFGAVAVFTMVNATVVNGGDLRVSFRVTGIESPASSADFEVESEAAVTYACVNKGGNNPRSPNKRTTINSKARGSVRLKPQNGVINGSVTVDVPEAPNFTCPSGQEKVVASVAFSNVQISSDSLGLSKSLSGAFRRTFVNLK